MGKVFRFPSTSDPQLFIRQFATDAEIEFNAPDGDEPKAVLVAIKTKSGQWLTGYCNLGFASRAEAMAHVQADIIDQMIRANAERYGLHTHE